MNLNTPNRFRYYAFWILDALKGGKIRKELKDIEHSHSLGSFELLNKKNETKLRKLLDTIVHDSEYYKAYKGYTNLRDFPVVNKHLIKENFDEMKMASPHDRHVHTIFTSGSTGTPFMIFQSQAKKNRNTADTIYFAKQAGFTLGDRLLYLRLWGEKLKKGKLTSFLQNIEQLNVDDLTPKYIEELLARLEKDKSPKGWLGYPSALEKVCDYLDSIKSKPLNCNVKSIIGMSEALSDDIRSRMWHYFNTPMVSRYSNFENGILAQQSINSDFFVINWASYIIEILNFDSNEPVKNGDLGRIVITDLYNCATPMIRYDTGDVGAMITTSNHTFPVLKTVEGRKTDIILDTKGEIISPFKFMSLVTQYPELWQVQFVQEEKTGYLIKVNVKNSFPQEMALVQSVRNLVGKNAKIKVEYVDEIPLLNSKKRKITRNLYTERSLQYV